MDYLGSSVLGLILLTLFFSIWSNQALNFEELPAVTMDYKVQVEARKQDCYYQFVARGATFYVSYQVIRGGDGMAGFLVRNPQGEDVHGYRWETQSDYQDVSKTGGYYTICVDNLGASFGSKLINLYITVIKYDHWEKYNQELEELHLSVENVTSLLSNVEHNINGIQHYQQHSRSREARDYNLLKDNNSYVFKWSLFQIILLTASSIFQVFFVRKLFEVKHFKPRA